MTSSHVHGRAEHSHGRDDHAALHGHGHAEAVEQALDALRARGERVTEPRRAVIAALARHHEHVTAERLVADIGDTGAAAHRATVFRTLERLAELGVVTRSHAGGDAAAYHLALAPHGHDHLHARCRRCGTVSVLPVDALRASVDRLRRERLFRLEPAASELVGLCPSCATDAAPA